MIGPNRTNSVPIHTGQATGRRTSFLLCQHAMTVVLFDTYCLYLWAAQVVQSLVWHDRRVAGGDDNLRDDERPLLAFKAELLLLAKYG